MQRKQIGGRVIRVMLKHLGEVVQFNPTSVLTQLIIKILKATQKKQLLYRSIMFYACATLKI